MSKRMKNEKFRKKKRLNHGQREYNNPGNTPNVHIVSYRSNHTVYKQSFPAFTHTVEGEDELGLRFALFTNGMHGPVKHTAHRVPSAMIKFRL